MLNKKIISLLVILTTLYCHSFFSQVTKIAKPVQKPANNVLNKLDKEKKYTRWSIKAGGNISVIFLARNVKEKNNEPGYCAGITYEVNDFIRVASLYTRFKPLNIEPTWLNINANTFETNVEILAKFPNNKTLLYPFVGISYNTFKGFFTGQSDYLNLREYYTVNSIVKNKWLGINLGTGVEHNFGILGVFIDYRMRVGRQDNAINIMDVCYTGGLRVHFPYGKFAKSIARPNDRFHWF